MTRARIAALFLALALAGLATDADAQHFVVPEEVDTGKQLPIGDPVALLARPTTSFGAVSLDGWLYVLGGYTGEPHDYHARDQSRDFYRISLFDHSVVQALPNEPRLQSVTLEAWNGLVIRTGGLVALNEADEDQTLRSIDDVHAFDPRTGEWSALPDMPEGRSSHDTAVLGSTLYVVGGWTIDDSQGTRNWQSDIWALDLRDTDRGWATIPTTIERRALTAVPVGGRIAIIGGMTRTGNIADDTDLFDPDTGEFEKGPSFPASAFGIDATLIDGRIVASASNGKVYTWRPGRSQWTHGATLTHPRFFHRIARGPAGEAYFIGGISRGVRPRHIERVDFTDRRRRDPRTRHWTIPSPSPAKNRQASFVHDGWLYTFGGNNSVGQHDFERRNFLDNGFRFSLADFQWQEIEPYPARRQTVQTTLDPETRTVHALGGFGHDGDVARTHREGFAFDLQTGTWSDATPDLPVPRSQFGFTHHDGRLWVFGGLDYDPRREEGDRFRHLTPVLSAPDDGSASLFTDTGARLTTPRRAFGGARLNGRYYLVGGMRGDFQIVDSCEVFDFETQQFTPIAAPERPRLSPELVAMGGKLYLAGGSSPKADGDGLEENRSVEVYDPEADTWTRLIDELPVSTRHMHMFADRGQLLFATTNTDGSRLIHVLRTNPHTTTNHTR